MSVGEKVVEGVATKVAIVGILAIAGYFGFKYFSGKVSEKAGAYVNDAKEAVSGSTIGQAYNTVTDLNGGFSGTPAILWPSIAILNKGYEWLTNTDFTLGGGKKAPSVTDTANTAGIPYRSGWANSDYIDPITKQVLNDSLPDIFNFSLDGK